VSIDIDAHSSPVSKIIIIDVKLYEKIEESLKLLTSGQDAE